MNTIASIIIPTHNRSASLKRMLENLMQQSYPLQNFEVIVVADGCTDDTITTVKNYKAAFNLALCELPGSGAAGARNKGASVAKGRYLIFVDDDMELTADFIKEHVALHENENQVVIGYSPFKLESRASIQRMTLREWWEGKFQAMRNKRHRFRYDDLTSGNFSISNKLFNEVGGFSASLQCREDYELGFRLIKAGAQFCFAYKAMAFHCDEVTDFKRSVQRKKSEAIADVQMKTMHPDFVNKDALFYLNQGSFFKAIILRTIQYAPALSDMIANCFAMLMLYFEKLKMRSSWLKMDYRLHQYWYLRGLMISIKSIKKLHRLISNKETAYKNQRIDLKEGLKKVEAELDVTRPLGIDIYYDQNFIGSVNYEVGSEPIRGVHLRQILKENFSNGLASVLMPEGGL